MKKNVFLMLSVAALVTLPGCLWNKKETTKVEETKTVKRCCDKQHAPKEVIEEVTTEETTTFND